MALALAGQTFGEITGAVTDTTGGVLVGARITVWNLATIQAAGKQVTFRAMLFGDMLRRIWALPVPGGQGRLFRAGDLGVEEAGSERCETNRLSGSETVSADDKNRPWDPFDTVVACLTGQSRCTQEKSGSTMFESEFQIENSGSREMPDKREKR